MLYFKCLDSRGRTRVGKINVEPPEEFILKLNEKKFLILADLLSQNLQEGSKFKLEENKLYLGAGAGNIVYMFIDPEGKKVIGEINSVRLPKKFSPEELNPLKFPIIERILNVRRYPARSSDSIADYLYAMVENAKRNFKKEFLAGVVRFITDEEARRELGITLSKNPFYIDPYYDEKHVIWEISIGNPLAVWGVFTKKSNPLEIDQVELKNTSAFWETYSSMPELKACHLVGYKESSEDVVHIARRALPPRTEVSPSSGRIRIYANSNAPFFRSLPKEDPSTLIPPNYHKAWPSKSKSLSYEEREKLIKNLQEISIFEAEDKDVKLAYEALRVFRKARRVPSNEPVFSFRMSRRYPHLMLVDIQGEGITQDTGRDTISLCFAYDSNRANIGSKGWNCLTAEEIKIYLQDQQHRFHQFLKLQIDEKGCLFYVSENHLKGLKAELACALWSIADCRLDAKHYLPRPYFQQQPSQESSTKMMFFSEQKSDVVKLTEKEMELARGYIGRDRETQDIIIFESSGKGPTYVKVRLLNLYECAEAIETKKPAERFGRCYEVGLDEIKKWVENEKNLHEVEELARELRSGPN